MRGGDSRSRGYSVLVGVIPVDSGGILPVDSMKLNPVAGSFQIRRSRLAGETHTPRVRYEIRRSVGWEVAFETVGF